MDQRTRCSPGGQASDEDRRVSKGIERAQKKVEERNFETRKNLLEYDEVMDYQRREFYSLRQQVLEGRDLQTVIRGMIEGTVDDASIRRRVQEILETEINPSIAGHGGFIRLVDVKGSRVFLQMGGGCQGCGMAHITLREGVEHMLRARIPEITEILDQTDHASGANPFYAR